MVYKFFNNNSATCADAVIGRVIKSKNMLNQQLTDELHKPVISKVVNAKYIHLLDIVCRVLMQQIWSRSVDIIKEFSFDNALLIFIVTMVGLFL